MMGGRVYWEDLFVDCCNIPAVHPHESSFNTEMSAICRQLAVSSGFSISPYPVPFAYIAMIKWIVSPSEQLHM